MSQVVSTVRYVVINGPDGVTHAHRCFDTSYYVAHGEPVYSNEIACRKLNPPTTYAKKLRDHTFDTRAREVTCLQCLAEVSGLEMIRRRGL